jgi:hypothetical protein
MVAASRNMKSLAEELPTLPCSYSRAVSMKMAGMYSVTVTTLFS